jgi:ferredoxin
MKRISGDELKSLLESLTSEGYEVYVPAEDKLEFAKFDPGIQIHADGITRKSIKSILFPQTEVLLRWRGSEGEAVEVPPDGTRRLIFGVRPCDSRALSVLDKVFMGDVVDPYYAARRRNTVIFSMACTRPADEYCFCLMVAGMPFSDENSDAIFIDMGDHFLADPVTERGMKLLERYPDVSKEEVKLDEMVERATDAIRENLSRIGLSGEAIRISPDKLWDLFNSEIWEETHWGCIGCGVCSFLCPTCHCFDISDERFKEGGVRIRVWDTCAFPVFTKQASGHNPRPTQRERMRQRVMHKFCYMPENLQILGCVGCGRCVRYCPGGNDIRHTLARLIASIERDADG